MSHNCVRKGCGKAFDQPDESKCIYHPGPPIFHEGQKGWKCCKPRVLTFDEFLSIPPCSTADSHTTIEETPLQESTPAPDVVAAPPPPKPVSEQTPAQTSQAAAPQPTATVQPKAEGVEDSDDPSTPIPSNTTCKRRGCELSSASASPRTFDSEECIFHPGVPVFHEGSKGWTCCKRRVLEFDEFLKITGCKTRKGHCFIGKRGKNKGGAGGDVEVLEDVRSDFYQTASTVIASLYLKKVDKEKSRIEFVDENTIGLDLITSDGKKFAKDLPLFGNMDVQESSFQVMGTKIEFNLKKRDGGSWATFRSDEKATGKIIQTGRAGRA